MWAGMLYFAAFQQTNRMYIKSISIRNIRSYAATDIELSPAMNLITGNNNSGKSTILKVLYRLQRGMSQLQKNDIRKTFDKGRVHYKLASVSPHDIRLFRTQENRAIPHKEEIDVFLSIYNGQKADDLLIVNTDVCDVVTDDDIYATPREDDGKNDFFSFEGFADSEDQNNFIYPFLSKRKTSYYSSQAGKQGVYSVDDDFKNLPRKIQKLTNPSHPQYEQYIKLCRDILGFDIGNVHADDNTSQDKIGFYSTGVDPIYLENMGEGVANVLGLLSILLTENNKLFIIEELENDIHPQALKKLLDLIVRKSGTNQFIISTHSNIVLKHLATIPEALIFFTDWKMVKSREGIQLPTSEVSLVENTPESRLRILERLGYELLDFDLYKSYIIFEESSAEQLVKDLIIPQFFPELLDKVKTIAAGGADDIKGRMSDFLRLIVYLNGNAIYQDRTWVIADGDKAGMDAIKQLKAKFTKLPANNFIALSKSNIEEYYPTRFKKQFDLLKNIADPNIRRNKKIELNQSVFKFIRENPLKAKADFAKSADEIIQLFKTISLQLE